MQAARSATPPTDEELMRRLGQGQEDALGALYSRYAGLVFHLGVQSLGRAAAEEMVQEVFLTIWRGAATFDASQGAFRPWLLRLTHWRILNELRRRRRRPSEQTTDAEDEPVDLPADEPGPEERAWRSEHGQILYSALQTLPLKQRQAVALAFLEDMTHEQVAQILDVPLGTAKTRIRSGLLSLRARLAPIAASLLGVGLVIASIKFVQTQQAFEREQRVLLLVTSSDSVPLRLTPGAGAPVPADAHANYRWRSGSKLAVLSVEHLAAGQTYQAWVRHGERWVWLGSFSESEALLIGESDDLTTAPDEIVVTLEPRASSRGPSGPRVLEWTTGP